MHGFSKSYSANISRVDRGEQLSRSQKRLETMMRSILC